MKKAIMTPHAPAASGTYSQAIRFENTVYLAGQIPLDPKTMNLISDDFKAQVTQVFQNLRAVCQAAGGDLENILRLTVYLMDMKHFPIVNEVMTELFKPPYPARTTFQVAGLPKGALVEIDAMMAVIN